MAASVADALKAAASKVGAPYVWGATGPDRFDCSGLMVWAWNKAGVQLPRTSQAQAKFGKAVKPKDIKPGDLVTSNWGSGPSSHVAMYIGGGKLIHAPRPGKGVTIAKFDKTYASKVNAIRRIPGLSYAGVDTAGFDLPDIDLPDIDLPGLGDLGEGIVAPFKLIAEQMTGIAKGMLAVGQFAEFLLKLALPSTWVRIVCGWLGTVVLFLGLFFMIREARAGGA